MRSKYLLPIPDREALAWIVREHRTAFAEHRARDADRLEPDDVLVLYTTRGCFRNPTRDRGRVIGRPTVTAPAMRLTDPVMFGGREFPYLGELRIESLAPSTRRRRAGPTRQAAPRDVSRRRHVERSYVSSAGSGHVGGRASPRA
jgi:hypothetical protein